MKFEHVIGYFPSDIIDNAEVMEYLRRAFEKCNAKAFNNHAKVKKEDIFDIYLDVNGMERKFTFAVVENVKFSEELSSPVYKFKVVDRNGRNNFQILSAPDIGLVSIRGILENEKVGILSVSEENEELFLDKKVKNVPENKREQIAKSSVEMETRYTNYNRRSYERARRLFEKEQTKENEQAI